MPELTNCAKDLGAMHPAWSEYGWRINLKRWGFYSYHQMASLLKRLAMSALPVLEDERRRLIRNILLWVSGEVQIFARRCKVS